MRRSLFVLGLVAVMSMPARATLTVIDFDNLATSTIVTNQYAGLTFSGATVLTKGVNLNSIYPPESGANVVYDSTNGTIGVNFASATDSVGGYITGNTSITLFAYSGINGTGTLLGTMSTGGANYVGAGTGLSPNIFLS
ncbi:MAG: hypothetical protein ABSE84_19160, partial [Isosphaeraceae bacterium]